MRIPPINRISVRFHSVVGFQLPFIYRVDVHINFFISEHTPLDLLNRWTANKVDAVVVAVE